MLEVMRARAGVPVAQPAPASAAFAEATPRQRQALAQAIRNDDQEATMRSLAEALGSSPRRSELMAELGLPRFEPSATTSLDWAFQVSEYVESWGRLQALAELAFPQA